jgi:hypothetical protein
MSLFDHYLPTAEISSCGKYRYELTRTFHSGPTLGFVMLNPSTADALIDDPTIRKCRGFAMKHGYGKIQICNLFGLRATDPKDLRFVLNTKQDAIGPRNEHFICKMIDEVETIVLAWGNDSIFHNKAARMQRDRVIQGITDHHNAGSICCFGMTVGGNPIHPLYVPYDNALPPFVYIKS